jgi:hypothetical protein
MCSVTISNQLRNDYILKFLPVSIMSCEGIKVPVGIRLMIPNLGYYVKGPWYYPTIFNTNPMLLFQSTQYLDIIKNAWP